MPPTQTSYSHLVKHCPQKWNPLSESFQGVFSCLKVKDQCIDAFKPVCNYAISVYFMFKEPVTYLEADIYYIDICLCFGGKSDKMHIKLHFYSFWVVLTQPLMLGCNGWLPRCCYEVSEVFWVVYSVAVLLLGCFWYLLTEKEPTFKSFVIFWSFYGMFLPILSPAR